MHVRQQILAAIKTAITGLGLTGSNAFLSRVTLLQPSELPALIVRAGDDALAGRSGPAPRLMERTFVVDVEVYVRATDGLDAALNAIFAQVEPALAMPVVLAGVKVITLTRIERPQQVQGEQPLAVATMRYDVDVSDRGRNAGNGVVTATLIANGPPSGGFFSLR
jgi:hypothetical protein